MSDHTFQAFLIWFAIAIAAFFGVACGGPPRWAQGAASTAAMAVESSSDITAPFLERDARRIADDLRLEMPELVGEPFMNEWRRRTIAWKRVADAHSGAASWLRMLQRAIDVWDHGGESDFMALAPCLLGSLGKLVDALEAVDVPIPESLTEAIKSLDRFGSSLCEMEAA